MVRYSVRYCRILIIYIYRANPDLSFVGNKFALSKSVNELFLINFTRPAKEIV